MTDTCQSPDDSSQDSSTYAPDHQDANLPSRGLTDKDSLDGSSETPTVVRSRPSHARIDSVPPRLYDIQPLRGQRHPGENVANDRPLVPRFEDPDRMGRYESVIREEDSEQAGELDVASLSFVDIRLDGDAGDQSNRNPNHGRIFADSYPPQAHTSIARHGGRSSVEIRLDNISSEDVTSTTPPHARTSSPSQSAGGGGGGGHASSPLPSPLDRGPSRRFISTEDPLGRQSSDRIRRSAEGRYRGRKSQASSRANSPEPFGQGEGSEPSSRRASGSFRHGTSRPTSSSGPSIDRSIMHRRTSSSSSTSSVGSQSHFRITPSQPNGSNKDPPRLEITSEIPAGVGMAVADEDGEVQIISTAAAPSQLTWEERATEVETEVKGDNSPSHGDGIRGKAMGIEDEVREQKDASEGEKAQIEVGSSDTTASGTQDGAESARVEVPASPESDKSATKSPTLSDVADSPREKGRRPSKGPSALEQVMSKTRMMHLPPKQKNEEAKHLEDFERMMKAHKAFEKKKEAELAEKRRKKDEERREASAVWEKDILPSWTRARKDERLRQVWWKGAPPAFRGRVWALAIGNAQMLPRNLLDLASKSISEHKKDGTFPKGVSEEIREDVKNTLPSLKLFQEGTGPMNEDLVNLLEAYVVVRMDQALSSGFGDIKGKGRSIESGGEDEWQKRGITLYHKGTSSLAALLLINQPPSSAFISLLNLIWSRPWLKAIHSVKPAMSRYTEMKGFERVFDTLLADQMPKVYANMLARGLSISETILRAWVAHMFGKWLDCDTVMRLWDVILLDESDSLIYRICLALVQTLESRLYVPDKEEMRSVLEGTNQAALRIWRRERAPLLVAQRNSNRKTASTEPSLNHHIHSPKSTSSPSPSQSSDGSHAFPGSVSASASVSGSATAGGSVPAGTASNDGISKETIDTGSPDAPSASEDDRETGEHPRNCEDGVHQVGEKGSGTNGVVGRTRASSFEPELDEVVPLDNIYEQYGINEEVIFRALEAQESWWKQSTLERLLDRELAG